MWLNKSQLDYHICFCSESVAKIACHIASGKLYETIKVKKATLILRIFKKIIVLTCGPL
jgi:hypothetical protein